MRGSRFILAAWLLLTAALPLGAATVRIGSKSFTESYVLAEIALRSVENTGLQALHRPGMGGTIVLWQALTAGAIDAYPDYTGTISEQILRASSPQSTAQISSGLAEHDIGMTGSLGFDNTYAIVMRRGAAARLGIRTISDLATHPDLEVGLTHEFLERRDGWRPLAARYQLQMLNVRGLEHALAYPALVRGELDVMDAYSTDAKLSELDLVALEDDRAFFPRYEAVFLYRLDLEPSALQALQSLVGSLDEARMIRLNAVAEQTRDYSAAANLYFGQATQSSTGLTGIASRIAGWTLRHLQLVVISLTLAILIGCAARHPCRPAWRFVADDPGYSRCHLHGPFAGADGDARRHSHAWDLRPHRDHGTVPLQPSAHRSQHRDRPTVDFPRDSRIGGGTGTRATLAPTQGPAAFGHAHRSCRNQDECGHQRRDSDSCRTHRSGRSRRADLERPQSE